jgi:hypothetical protein
VNPEELIRSLESSGRCIVQFYESVSPAAAGFRPEPGKWSLLEILCHLGDEERHDFRMRVRSTLEDPKRPWPPIDPEALVTERKYAERDLAASLADFRRERADSLTWLRGLSPVSWEEAHEHPRMGTLRTGDLLAAWAAHDLLHLRQMTNTRLAYLKHAVQPFSTRYAG